MTAIIPSQRSRISDADRKRFNHLLDAAAAQLRQARVLFRLGRLDDVEAEVDKVVDWLGSELTEMLGDDADSLRDPAMFRRIGELILARAGAW